jgi:multiple sugar transport system substrate-binding protein
MQKRHRMIRSSLIGITVLAALTGCLGKTSEPVTKVPVETVKKRLKVVYFSESQFMREFGDSFKKIRPEIDIQVIPTGETVGGKRVIVEMPQLLEQKPDIVFGLNMIAEMSKAGKLVELSPLIKQDQLDMNDFSPAVLEQLRAIFDGKLVGFSPTFQTAALFYNKSLFDQAGIAYPTNNMSWPTVLELAKKFARTDEGKQRFGLDSYRAPNLFLTHYLGLTDIQTRSDDGKTVLYASDEHRTAVNAVVEAYKAGAIYLPPEKASGASSRKEVLLQNKFIAGEAAMAFSDPRMIANLKEAAVLGIPPFAWDIVTEPVNPSKPNVSYSVIPGDVFAINSDSPDMMTAWEFIKTITGPEMADEIVKTKPYVLSTRKDHVLTVDGRKMDAFYALGGLETISGTQLNLWSAQLSQLISVFRTEELTNIIYGRKTVAEGLSSLQKRAEQAVEDEFAMKK